MVTCHPNPAYGREAAHRNVIVRTHYRQAKAASSEVLVQVGREGPGSHGHNTCVRVQIDEPGQASSDNYTCMFASGQSVAGMCVAAHDQAVTKLAGLAHDSNYVLRGLRPIHGKRKLRLGVRVSHTTPVETQARDRVVGKPVVAIDARPPAAWPRELEDRLNRTTILRSGLEVWQPCFSFRHAREVGAMGASVARRRASPLPATGRTFGPHRGGG